MKSEKSKIFQSKTFNQTFQRKIQQKKNISILERAFNLMLNFKIFQLLPDQHKSKAIYFIAFLLIATILETAGSD